MTKSKRKAGEEALELASQFREASKAVGDYLYGNWSGVPAGDRVTLQGLEITLLNLATDLVSQAVASFVAVGEDSIVELVAATKIATDAVSKVNSAKKVIRITTALIGLAASIPTGNWAGIKPAVDLLVGTVSKELSQD
jgi:hypothetical protein